MIKYLLPISFALIFLVGFNSSELTLQNRTLDATPIPTPTPDEQEGSENFNLDKDEICIPCPPGVRPNEDSDCDINMVITVVAGKTENKNLKYNYNVSGGRIIGEGSKVTWDMTGAAPGTYQISVDVRNKLKELQRKEIKTITVMGQACGGVCVCPTLSITAPTSPTEAGKLMIFTANVSGGSGQSITCDWTVSDGEIVEGQGTPVIKVMTNSRMVSKIIKATVEIGGVCEECPTMETADGTVINAKPNKK